MSEDRWFYVRLHDHPLGWGVRDAKTGETVAYGDKNICFTVATLLNGNPDPGLLTDWPRAFDFNHAARQAGVRLIEGEPARR